MGAEQSTSPRPEERCFGEYKCPNCYRKWNSANSWANYGQKCVKCNTNVLPYKLTPLKKTPGSDKLKGHQQELCGKCKSLGRPCGNQ